MIHYTNFIGAVPPSCCLSTSRYAATPAAAVGASPSSAPPCPTKRDFQFQVIQVHQGPKWFIWPSLNQSQRKEKTDNNKKQIHNNNIHSAAVNNNYNNNNCNNNNKAKSRERSKAAEKPPYLNVDSGYVTGNCCSELEIISNKIFSSTSPTFMQIPIANALSGNAGADMVKNTVAPTDRLAHDAPGKVSSQYQARFHELACHLQAIQRTISLPNEIVAPAATVPSPPLAVDVPVASVEPRCTSAGAFEILAVSQKADDEIDDDEDEEEGDLRDEDAPLVLDAKEENRRFADSGYSGGGNPTPAYYSKKAVYIGWTPAEASMTSYNIQRLSPTSSL